MKKRNSLLIPSNLNENLISFDDVLINRIKKFGDFIKIGEHWFFKNYRNVNEISDYIGVSELPDFILDREIFIAQSKHSCNSCKYINDVYALAAYDCWVKSYSDKLKKDVYYNVKEFMFFINVPVLATKTSQLIGNAIDVFSQVYYADSDGENSLLYYGNTCKSCKKVILNEEIHTEPGTGFFPTEKTDFFITLTSIFNDECLFLNSDNVMLSDSSVLFARSNKIASMQQMIKFL